MVSWKKFVEANPPLAKTGEDQIFQFGVGLAFLATIRKNGAPRLHPVCPVLSESRLFVLITPDSPKLQDLEFDGRYALQSFPQPKASSDEFYLSGSACRIDDQTLYAKVLSDAKHQASPDEILFELKIERAMHTRWEGFGTSDYHSIHSKWSS